MSADSQRGRSASRSSRPAAPPSDEFGGQTTTTGGPSIADPRGAGLPDAGLDQDSPHNLGRRKTELPPDVRSDRAAKFTRAKTGRHRRPGLVDGRYELEEMISKGGMGRVFRARHRDLGRKVALKLVLDGFQDNREARELFFKEARLASSLSHPNIIDVTDFGLDDQLGYFVVMDLLEGETLRERMRRRRPNLRFAFDVLDQVAGAVRYIHGRDIVHCDLKPENIFLARVEGEPRRVNEVKLLDFGLSWRQESMPDATLGGTPPYLAPERLRGFPPSPECDVYSLGMILYEIIAGQLPYGGAVAKIIDDQLNGRPPDPPSTRAAEPVDPHADALVLRALSRKPEDRHPSAEAFQLELRALMSAMGMKVRRSNAVADSVPTLDAEVVMQAVLDSPVPLAIFDNRGAVRMANRGFIEAMEGVLVPVANFNELAIARRHPDLHGVFQRAVEGKGPMSKVVLAGPEGGEHPTLLWIAPLVKDGVCCGVHMTVVLSGATAE